jgi:hypothetical protein
MLECTLFITGNEGDEEERRALFFEELPSVGQRLTLEGDSHREVDIDGVCRWRDDGVVVYATEVTQAAAA